MAQPRPRNGWRRAPISLSVRAKMAGMMRAASSAAKINGSKMKTMSQEYQRGLKGKKGPDTVTVGEVEEEMTEDGDEGEEPDEEPVWFESTRADGGCWWDIRIG